MRRKDKEVLDQTRIRRVISDTYIIRVGFYDKENDEVYIVPLHFGYKDDENIFYLHAALEGRKNDLLAANHKVGFELEANVALGKKETPGQYTFDYESIIGVGSVYQVEDVNEKQEALKLIVQQSTGEQKMSVTEESVKGVAVFRLEVEKMSCKAAKQ